MKSDEDNEWPETENPEEVLNQFVHELTPPISAIKVYATLVLQDRIDGREAAEKIYDIATAMDKVQNSVFNIILSVSPCDVWQR